MKQSKSGGQMQPIILTEKQEAWLQKHFKHTKNEDIAIKLDVSLRSVSRLARQRGLTKSPQFIRKCQNEAMKKAHEVNLRNGNYPPKGYRIPNSEKYYFKKGERIIDRIGPKREAERLAKSVASRKETFRLEKARALFGLPRQTKLQVVQRPRKLVHVRYRLRKRGYDIERGSMVAYYNQNTRRDLALEQTPRTGFTFIEQ